MVFFVWLVFVPPSYLPPLLPSLPPSLFCPMLYTSHRFYCSCVQHRTKKLQLGPKRQSEEEGSGGVCAAQGPGPPQQPPSLHLQSETQGNMDTCASRTGENNRVHSGRSGRKENELLFDNLLEGKRTEIFLCRNRRTAFLLVIS